MHLKTLFGKTITHCLKWLARIERETRTAMGKIIHLFVYFKYKHRTVSKIMLQIINVVSKKSNPCSVISSVEVRNMI